MRRRRKRLTSMGVGRRSFMWTGNLAAEVVDLVPSLWVSNF